MNEKPILFSTEMVQAILKGHKTQTRRVIMPQITWRPMTEFIYQRRKSGLIDEFSFLDFIARCPYGQPGDLLWVRESFAYAPNGKFLYRANFPGDFGSETIDLSTGETMPLVWRPSIHMPRKACRITLQIVNVRVERVQEISKEDILAEGINAHFAPRRKDPMPTPRSAFAQLWDNINKYRGFGWDVNPWVWAIHFQVVK